MLKNEHRKMDLLDTVTLVAQILALIVSVNMALH